MRLLLATAVVSIVAATAQAQPRAAMLQTSASGSGAAEVGAAFDRIARSRLDALAPMPLESGPPLPLEDLQLAVGCVGESTECLQAVAERLGVQVLVVPGVEAAGDAYVGSFLRLDAADGRVRRVTRRTRSEGELLDEVDAMLRELFDLPPAPPEPPREGTGGASADPALPPAAGLPAEPGPADSSFTIPTGPAIVAGVGLAALAGSVVFGVLAANDEDAYLETSTETREGVDAARDHLDAAERNALVANVLLGVGAGAIVGGLVWWLVGEDSPLSVAATPHGAALSVRGSMGGGS